MTTEIVHEKDAHRYVLRIDGQVGSVLDYSISGDAISFSRTFTNPPFRGRGLAGEVTAFAVDDVEQHTGYRIVPMCWYVAEWFDQHPERAGLLSRAGA